MRFDSSHLTAQTGTTWVVILAEVDTDNHPGNMIPVHSILTTQPLIPPFPIFFLIEAHCLTGVFLGNGWVVGIGVVVAFVVGRTLVLTVGLGVAVGTGVVDIVGVAAGFTCSDE